MKYLLDTNICIYVLKEKPPEVIARFRALSPNDIGLSTITIAELRHGASNSEHPIKNNRVIDIFIAPLVIEHFSNEAASYYGKIYAQLRKKGTPIGQMDSLIAAHALALGVKLVTNNGRELSRVPHLQWENWAS